MGEQPPKVEGYYSSSVGFMIPKPMRYSELEEGFTIEMWFKIITFPSESTFEIALVEFD
jgi:hypothetical protein